MNAQTKIKIAAAAIGLLIVGIIAGHLWSNHQIRRLEKTVEVSKAEAAAKQEAAAEAEKAAASYKQKIEFLESNVAEIRAKAGKQDEEVEKLIINTDRARRAVECSRNKRVECR